MKDKETNLGLIFTLGASLETWKKQGLLSRERVVYDNLLKTGVLSNVYLFTYGTNDNLLAPELGDRYVVVSMPKLFNFKFGKLIYSFLLPLIRRIHLRKCDVIKTNQLKGAWTAVLAKALFKNKTIVRAGYLWTEFLLKSGSNKIVYKMASVLERFSFINADMIVITSDRQKTYLVDKYNLLSARINVIPNYVDTSVFKPYTCAKINRLVTVGRLNKQKNIETMIKSLVGTNYGLDIYGTGELQQELENLAKKNGVDVLFKGNVRNAELPKLISQYPIFLFVSWYEGNPKALIEAMACSRLCVVSNVAGINDVATSDRAVLVTPDDHTILKEKLEELMENYEDFITLASNARDYIVSNYDIKVIIAEEVKNIKDLLNNN